MKVKLKSAMDKKGNSSTNATNLYFIISPQLILLIKRQWLVIKISIVCYLISLNKCKDLIANNQFS